MTQGAVKTTGKRSRAVRREEEKAILSAALDTFFTIRFSRHKAGADRRVGRRFKTNLLYYFPSKRGAVYSRTAADSRYLAGTVKSVS